VNARSSKRYTGIAVAPGVAVGKVRMIDVGHFPRQVPDYELAPEDIPF